MSNDQPIHAELCPELAFVVQFIPSTQVDASQMDGRVERVVSRRSTRFQSLEALVAFIDGVLQVVRDSQPTAES